MNPRKQPLPTSAQVATRTAGPTRFATDQTDVEPDQPNVAEPDLTSTARTEPVRENVRLVPSEPASAASHRAHRYLDEPSFAECLNRQMRDSGIGLRELARRSWLDIGYVSRLVNMEADLLNLRYGEQRPKHQPSRDAVIRLGLAMNLPIEEMDELLLTAGFAPLVR